MAPETGRRLFRLFVYPKLNQTFQMIPANYIYGIFQSGYRPFSRPWLSLWALVSASGASSTCWKVTATTTPVRMLMYGKEASNRKQ